MTRVEHILLADFGSLGVSDSSNVINVETEDEAPSLFPYKLNSKIKLTPKPKPTPNPKPAPNFTSTNPGHGRASPGQGVFSLRSRARVRTAVPVISGLAVTLCTKT